MQKAAEALAILIRLRNNTVIKAEVEIQNRKVHTLKKNNNLNTSSTLLESTDSK